MIKKILSTLADSILCFAFVVSACAFVLFMLCPWYAPSVFHATDGFAWLYGGMALCLSILSFNILEILYKK